MNHRVGLANRVQKLIADAFALRRTADQTGDIDKLDGRGHDLVGLHQLCQRSKSLVGDGNHTDVRLTRRKRVIGGDGGGLQRYRVEESCFSGVR